MIIVFISDMMTKFALYDFKWKKWTEIPNMDEEFNGFKLTCAMTAVFDKQAIQKQPHKESYQTNRSKQS